MCGGGGGEGGIGENQRLSRETSSVFYIFYC